MSKKTAIYSGTFDPITLGHLDVIGRAARLFDEVVVAVASATQKQTIFSLEERVALCQAACAEAGLGRRAGNSASLQPYQSTELDGKVRVVGFDGLLVDFCRQSGASLIVRGIRHGTDLDYEIPMAGMNRMMCPEIEMVFLLSRAEVQCISSTLVREIAKLGGDVSQMVSPQVNAALMARFSQGPTLRC